MTRLLTSVVAASVLALAVVADATAAAAAPVGASVVRGVAEGPVEEPAPDSGPVGDFEEIDESAPADTEPGDIDVEVPEGAADSVVGDEKDPRGRAIRPGAIVTVAERVHIAHSEGARAAHAHGCWRKLAGSGTLAKVTVWLQLYKNGAWTTVKKKVQTVGHGCGRGKRVTARFECQGMVAWRDYRSIVDVDVIGVLDGSEKATSATQRLWCWG